MKKEIGQGTIIYGARSVKYPETKCYSIIISARCDVSNEKIDKVYFITALDVKEWFCTKKGFEVSYKKDLSKRIEGILNQKKINLNVLISMADEDREQVLSRCSKKEQDIVQDFLNSDDMEIRRKLIRNNPKIGINFLKDINEAKAKHYFFIPEMAYLKNEKKDKGLIVDLQEIDYYGWEEIEKIKSPGIDVMILCEEKNKQKVKRWKKLFWLDEPQDFVDVEQTIISPWCELLMQRFAMDFTRIGVDGAREIDYKNIIDKI